MRTVDIAVRTLVEHVYRSGSIETGFQAGASLQEGIRIHQRVQSEYGPMDEKEVQMKTELVYDGMLFVVEGRCDGLLLEDRIVIDEIKSTSSEIFSITEKTHPVHWAQAKWYAYMYAKDHGLAEITVQVTYVQVATGEEKRLRDTYTFEALSDFVIDIVRQYAPYAKLLAKHREKRNASIQALAFPFPSYRDGQRTMAGAVYKTIAAGKNVLAQAPTGIGKTISTTFPAVKAIGEGLAERIFYITAKTITRTVAEDAFLQMEEKGLVMHAVTITAKDKVCFQEETRCQKEYCPFADGYYDRINGAVFDILQHETVLTRAVIEVYARKHTVCPFEFSVELAYVADAVICDYNYVFDPRVSFKRLFEEGKKKTVLCVDEAHNLVDRGREMFSATLQKSLFLQVKRQCKDRKGVYEAAHAINQYFIVLRKKMDGKHAVQKERDAMMLQLIEAFLLAVESEMAKGTELAPCLLDAYFSAYSFQRSAALYDERFVSYVEMGKNEVTYKLFCLDPSYLLRKMSKNYRAKMYFSATLTPLSYYWDMLGLEDDDFSLRIPSPFRSEQLEVLVKPISTKYQDRERTKPQVVEALLQFVEQRRGNYLFFFPSYQYLQDVYALFTDADVKTIVQGMGMNETERERFLEAFQSNPKETLVGFAVLGGIFSEGIDLKGDRLNGVAIIGVGLPQLGLERNVIKDYFTSIGKNGYDYAYVFPGMNKVAQAGGRLIRSETDTGRILLLDNRFLQAKYKQLLPNDWQGMNLL